MSPNPNLLEGNCGYEFRMLPMSLHGKKENHERVSLLSRLSFYSIKCSSEDHDFSTPPL